MSRVLLNRSESSKLSLHTKMDMYNLDYELLPLLLQENYITSMTLRNSKAGFDINELEELVSAT